MNKLPPLTDLTRTPYKTELITIAPYLGYAIKHLTFDFDVYIPSIKRNLQRDLVWDLFQKQSLIESIIYRGTRQIPPIAVCAGDIHQQYQVIDGKQRLNAMFEFAGNKFKINLFGSDFSINQLPDDYRNWILGYPVSAYLAYDLTDKQKIDWFRRINFAGTPQDNKHLKMLETALNQIQS